MGFRSETPSELKWRERRRGVRMNSRVPIVVEWSAADGAAGREDAVTRIVSPHGCLVVLRHDLQLDQRVRVTNLSLNTSTDAVVVWRGSERAEGHELGIELLASNEDFWGLEL
jgi:hypothetical protein